MSEEKDMLGMILGSDMNLLLDGIQDIINVTPYISPAHYEARIKEGHGIQEFSEKQKLNIRNMWNFTDLVEYYLFEIISKLDQVQDPKICWIVNYLKVVSEFDTICEQLDQPDVEAGLLGFDRQRGVELTVQPKTVFSNLLNSLI